MEAWELAEPTQENLLDDLRGVGGVFAEAEGDAEGSIFVVFVERSEGGRITGVESGHEFGVGG